MEYNTSSVLGHSITTMLYLMAITGTLVRVCICAVPCIVFFGPTIFAIGTQKGLLISGFVFLLFTALVVGIAHFSFMPYRRYRHRSPA